MKGKKNIRDQRRQQKQPRPYAQKRWNGRPLPHGSQSKSGEK